jgi:hypothetical protein
MKKKENKKYNEYEKSRPDQLDLFSFSNIFEDKRGKYSGTVGIYDVVPKYYHGDVEKIRKYGKYLDILSREFVYKKQSVKVNITPAYLLQKDGVTKGFYPTQREEIIEDVLRKFATDMNRSEYLDDRLSVRFTLYDLWKELRNIKHGCDYDEIKESLEILSSTVIEIKAADDRISIKSNMFETFGVVNENDSADFEKIAEKQESYSKNVTYFVRFNSLVSESIKNKTWRLINYEQCMFYRKAVSRYLHKRISEMFRTDNISLPYNIMLTTIITGSGMTEYKQIGDSIIQVKKCLDEMVGVGSVEEYEIERVYSEERKNKIIDVKFLIYVAKSFFDDMQLNPLVFKDKEEIKQIQDESRKRNDDKKYLNKKDNIGIQDKRAVKEITEKVISLLSSENLSVNGVDVEKTILLACIAFDDRTKENIILNTEACIEYVKNQEKEGKKCKTMAVLTKAIKGNWQPNGPENGCLFSFANEKRPKYELILEQQEKDKNSKFLELKDLIIKNFDRDYRCHQTINTLHFDNLDNNGIMTLKVAEESSKELIIKDIYETRYKTIYEVDGTEYEEEYKKLVEYSNTKSDNYIQNLRKLVDFEKQLREKGYYRQEIQRNGLNLLCKDIGIEEIKFIVDKDMYTTIV